MNDLTSRALELQHAAHELMYLGMDGEPVYSDTFCRLNKEVLVKSDSLFSAQSSDVEEEANLCLALLMGYNATIYDYGDKERKKQVLEKLPVSLLKVHLLVYTYGEVYEESMRCETYNIMKNWNMLDLSTEQKKVIDILKNIEENPYPLEIIE